MTNVSTTRVARHRFNLVLNYENKRYKLPLSDDEAIYVAAELVSEALHSCNEELRKKFQNLVRDICK